MGQGQVDRQQLHAQQKKLMVVPEEYIQRALVRIRVLVKWIGGNMKVWEPISLPVGSDVMDENRRFELRSQQRA